MIYFIIEKERKQSGGTCYLEFQKGSYTGAVWREDSLLIHVDIFNELKLATVFGKVITDFDLYGITKVDLDNWIKIYEHALNQDQKIKELFEELQAWVDECCDENEMFVILGI